MKRDTSWFKLVSPQIFSAAVAACSTYVGARCQIFGTMLADRHEQLVVEEGDIAKVFVEDVGLGAGAEIASRPITGLQRGRQQAGVFAGRCFFSSFFF